MYWIIKIEFGKSSSASYKKAVEISKTLPHLAFEKDIVKCGIQTINEYLQHYIEAEELIRLVKNWKTAKIYFYNKPYKTAYDFWEYRQRVQNESGKYAPIITSHGSISIEELPYPFVFYPNSYGAFFLFAKDIDSPKYFCECERLPIMNYLKLRKLSADTYSSLTGAPLSSSFFPEIVANESLSAPEDPLSLYSFKPGLCHKCNHVIPKFKYCLPMYGSRFHQDYGWFITQKYFELGINPNENTTLGITQIPDCISTYDYVINVCKNDFLYPTSRWKGENQLFNIVKSVYPHEVILRNYRPKWLNGLELDIYIPELKLAFEYQGMQHYKPIQYWGGSKQFSKRKEHDKKKKELCSLEGIRLIAIKYDDELSENLIKRKVSF